MGPPGPSGWPGAGASPAPQTATRSRRIGARLAVAAVFALIAVLTAAGLVAVGARQATDGQAETSPSRTYPEAWDPRVAPIADWVEDERDLVFEHPVEVEFQTEADYLEAAGGDPVEADDEAAAVADDTVAVLRSLGLITGEVDLATAAGDLAGEATLAYYSPADEKVFVRGTELAPDVRVTLAHELTHVLQDQHFDLERVGDPEFERSEVLRAMAEGDAGRMEALYIDEELTAAEQRAYETETKRGIADARTTLDQTVPPALLTLQAAPYILGEAYVAFVETQEGAEEIDASLADPPSEEELLDPTARGTPAAEPVEVDHRAPEGVEVIEDDTIGPVAWYLLLASRGDEKAALGAVDGWAGDHYVAYEREGTVCTSATVVGDDAGATGRLGLVISAWAAQAPGGGVKVEKVGGEIHIDACDPGPDAGSAGAITEDLLRLPILRTQVWLDLQAGGATSTQADCATDRLLAGFTPEELTDPDGAADPALQQRIRSTVIACA